MNIYVFEYVQYSLEQIGFIDEYQSFIWTERYFTANDCELVVQATKKNIDMLKIGRFITHHQSRSGTICRICKVEVTTDANKGRWLIIKGEDLRMILNQRVDTRLLASETTAREAIKSIIDDNFTNPTIQNRKVPNMYFDNGSTTPTDAYVTEAGFYNCYEKIVEICKNFNYGTKMIFIDEGDVVLLIFNIYYGVDRSRSQSTNPAVIFSESMDALATTDYAEDYSTYKNLAIIAGEGDGADRQIERVTKSDDYVGFTRREVFIDGKSLTKKTNDGELTPAEYSAMLIQYAKDQLSFLEPTVSFSGTVANNIYKYKTDYNLGDIVTVESPLGTSYDARVVEIIENDDVQNGHIWIPKFDFIRQTT